MCFKGVVITAQYNLYTYRELYVLYMREMTLGNWHCLMMHQGKEKLQTTYEEKKGSTQNMMTVMNFVLMCCEKLSDWIFSGLQQLFYGRTIAIFFELIKRTSTEY